MFYIIKKYYKKIKKLRDFNKMIPQIEPWIGEEELKEVIEVVKSGWLTESLKTKKFEELFKKLTNANYVHAYSNGTVTLFSALKILGIKEGDEVIVPNFTFIASPNSIALTGAKPVLVDIDRKTFNISPECIKSAITSKTKAIMPVHLYGTSADMDAIMKIAKENNLYVIEDAAQGIGVKFNGKHVGTFGEYGSFSLYGNKTVTTGEGGVLLTNDKTLSDSAYRFKNHGRLEKGVFIHETIGFNFSFTELQAAVGIAQLSKLDKIIMKKDKIRKMYMEKLSDVKEIEFTYMDQRVTPVHWFTNILVNDIEKLIDYLKNKGVGTRRFFYPINRQPCYNIKGNFPNTEYAYNHGLSLPSSVNLTESQIDEICNHIKAFYEIK